MDTSCFQRSVSNALGTSQAFCECACTNQWLSWVHKDGMCHFFFSTLEVESFINFHHHFQFVLPCAEESVYLLEFPSLLFPVSLPLFSEEPCLLSGSGMNLGGLSELFSQLRRRGCVKASASWQERGAISPDKAMADLRIVTKQTAWMQVGTRQCTCISLQPKIQAR